MAAEIMSTIYICTSIMYNSGIWNILIPLINNSIWHYLIEKEARPWPFSTEFYWIETPHKRLLLLFHFQIQTHIVSRVLVAYLVEQHATANLQHESSGVHFQYRCHYILMTHEADDKICAICMKMTPILLIMSSMVTIWSQTIFTAWYDR